MARTRSPRLREPERVRRERRDTHRVAHPVRSRRRLERRCDPVARDHAAVLEHERRPERAEVVEQHAVGAVAGGDRPDARQAMAERRVQRRQQQGVLGRDARSDRDAAHLVDVALAQQEVRLAVVGAEGAALRPVLAHERQQVAQVAGVRRLAQKHPRPAPPLLERLGQLRRLVIAADPGGEIGVELPADDGRRVTVDPLARREGDLRELLGRTGDDGGVVHHLRQADHALAREDPGDVLQRERRARRLEGARRHGRRGEDEDVEWQALAGVDEPVHALGAERVGELVRIADDCRRTAGDEHARQLRDAQLAGLDVHVRVDEAGCQEAPAAVDPLTALVGADAGEAPVRNGDVALEPFARERAEHPRALDHGVRRLVTSCHGQQAGGRQGVAHARTVAADQAAVVAMPAPCSRSRSAAMWPGPVSQQPPTIAAPPSAQRSANAA